MKKPLLRVCSLLLTIVMTAGLLPAFTAHASAATLEEKQAAILATAWAYYDKGRSVQYDSRGLCSVSKGKGGVRRITMECAPEYATPDETLYSVCSDFTYDVYFDVFGYRILGDPVTNCTKNMAKLKMGEDPIVAYFYDHHTNPTKATLREAIADMMTYMQPGDIINTVGSVGGNGHAMLYVGEVLGDGVKYLLQCGGGKYDVESGEDVVECSPGKLETIEGKITANASSQRNDGAILLSPVEEFLNANYGDDRANWGVFSLIRPLNVIKDAEYPMKPGAYSRLQFPRLVYNRTTSPYTRFTDVEAGGTVTLKVELKNCSQQAYTVPVKEVVPAGVTFVQASDGAQVSGNEISWDVSLNAGETKTVSYDCTVTAKRGETIVFANGKAGEIPSNSIRIPVGGKHLTDEENALLADIASGKYKSVYKNLERDKLATTVYRKILKLDVKFPTVKGTMKNMFKQVKVAKKNFYVFSDELEDVWKPYREMIVPEFAGGFIYGEMDSLKRVLDLKCKYLRPGDVVYEVGTTKGSGKIEILVYLGNEKFLRQVRSDGGAAVMDFFELQKAHTYQMFFAFRPTLAYDDVHTKQ